MDGFDNRGVRARKLISAQIGAGRHGAELDALTKPQRAALLRDTPLWFDILREAESNGGKLKGVPHRRGDLPPRHGRQQSFDRSRPDLASHPGAEQHDLPHGRSTALCVRGPENAAGPVGIAIVASRSLTRAASADSVGLRQLIVPWS